MLDVKLEERGESFYNPFLSQVVADLTSAELLEESEGAQVFVVCNKKDDKKLPVDRLRYRYLRRARVPSSVLCIPVSMSLNAHTHAHTHTHTHTHTNAQVVYVDGFTNKDGDRMPLLVQKSDGGFMYSTTDLAAIRQRVNAEVCVCLPARVSEGASDRDDLCVCVCARGRERGREGGRENAKEKREIARETTDSETAHIDVNGARVCCDTDACNKEYIAGTHGLFFVYQPQGAERVLYVTDAGQSAHFTQVFQVLSYTLIRTLSHTHARTHTRTHTHTHTHTHTTRWQRGQGGYRRL